MRKPRPLPPQLTSAPFDRRAATAARLNQGRLRRQDILRPYHGVHAASPPLDVLDRSRAYLVRLKPGQFFSHITAAQLLGLPLPRRLEDETVLHVAALLPAPAPQTRGVTGHRLRVAVRTVVVDGLPVCEPVEVWCQLAPVLTKDELIVMADALLARENVTMGDRDLLLRQVLSNERRVGAGLLRAALVEARTGSASPGETRARLILVRAGLPEPELNIRIHDDQGRYLGKGDLVWRRRKTLLEYEGDYHRTDEEQFRYDIRRHEQFKSAGWDVVRATGDDIRDTGVEAFVDRMRRYLTGL